MEKDMPVFVKIEEYKELLDIIELIKNKLVEAKAILAKINGLKNQEDGELETWRTELEDVDRRISLIDKTLLSPKMH